MMAHASVKEQLPKHGVFMNTVDGAVRVMDPLFLGINTGKH